MKNRVASIFSENDAKLLSIGTFHNLAAKILRTCISKWNNKMQGNFTILDRSDQEKIVLDICKQSDMEMTMKRNNSPLIREVLNFISKAKNEEKIPADFEKIDTQRKPNRWSKIGEDKTLMLANIYAQYESYKQDGNLVDFDDLLLGAVQLFKKNTAVRNIYAERCRALCIDEFQDISPLQLQFCQLLTSTHGHIFVVGDQDQLIYAWYGLQAMWYNSNSNTLKAFCDNRESEILTPQFPNMHRNSAQYKLQKLQEYRAQCPSCH